MIKDLASHRAWLSAMGMTVLGCGMSAQAQSEFHPLGFLPGGGTNTTASSISNLALAGGRVDQVVIAGNGDGPRGREAFRWTLADGMIGLGNLGGGFAFSNATGVSSDGTYIIGGAAALLGIEAFRWSIDSGMIGLGDLPGGPFRSEANGINGDGTIVVGASRSVFGPFGDEAFLWTEAGGMIGLGTLVGFDGFSSAEAISDDGLVVVGSSGFDVESALPFRWTPTTGMVEMPTLPSQGPNGNALGLSADGQVAVGWSTDSRGQMAVRWTAAGIEELGRLASFEGYKLSASAITDDHAMIVGWAERGTDLIAWTWTESTGMQTLHDTLTQAGLDLAGWRLGLALDVSFDPQSGKTAIVGSGTNPMGQSEAFLAIIDPSPPCRVDLDGDGEATIFDFLLFQTLFDAMDPRADFDGDGLFTVFDFLFFTTAFADGCP
ncbi:MAG: hypothetical protein KIT54_05815 [Phycisphaeraceae bacterium]|nr:hypothetical protein [Phycisphaeraceae bacterium]